MTKTTIELLEEHVEIMRSIEKNLDNIIVSLKMEEEPETGEHDCDDGTNGVGNIDGTDGHCTVCGKTNLI